MTDLDRRSFLVSSAGAAALASAPAFVKSALGANDRLRVAIVGLHGRGKDHMKEILQHRKDNVEIVAICDIDEKVLAGASDALEKQNVKATTYTDIRKLLEDKSIDAVTFATPNHWHALGTVWACQAGKDVYVEKPISHEVWEGRKMVEAARKYKRIVQVGTQSRSNSALREAVQHLRAGVIGDIYMARGLCFKWRDTIGKKPDLPAAPAGVHYDLWLGPARVRPFNENRFHYNWHWNWEYGNGDNGNQGIHEWDIARWGLGVKMPVRASSMGGHFMFDDDQQTPNTQVSTLEFEDNGRKQLLVFEVRHWMTNHEAGIGEGGRRPDSNTIGNIFYGSKGYMAISGYGSYKTFLGREQAPGPSNHGTTDHFGNFFTAVRSRKVEDLNADILEGHLSAVCMHLGNVSYRTGRVLNFDGATETIKGDAEASKLLRREYRKPYVVPDKV